MKTKLLKVNLFVLVIILCILSALCIFNTIKENENIPYFLKKELSENEDLIENGQNYAITELDNMYNIYLFSERKILFVYECPLKYNVNVISEDILEFHLQTGNPSPRYEFYFNTDTYQISDIYKNSSLIDNKYIYFVEYLYDRNNSDTSYDNAEKRLIIRDIFNSQTFYFEAYRDFEWEFCPTDAVFDIMVLSEKKQVYIKYLAKNNSGDYTEEYIDI